MCGIAGIYQNVDSIPFNSSVTEKAIKDIRHRGPDSSGHIYIDSKCLLIHSRLSIVDLSSAGNQPILSRCGNYIFVINGEIYNYKELGSLCANKLDIDNISDSIIALEFIIEFGLTKFLELAQGMWAFALYNKAESTLQLVRDISGQKPLFYYPALDYTFFASTLTSCIKFNDIKLSDKIIYNFVQSGSLSIDELGIVSINPGEIHEFLPTQTMPSVKKYFELNVNRFKSADLKEIECLLEKHVSWTLRSDAPIGLFLSGGVDSRLVAAIAKRVDSKKIVAAYTVAFDVKDFNESNEAKKVAQKLDLFYEEVLITPLHVKNFFENANFNEFDFMTDTSFLPIYFLAEKAKQKVKVVLTGDGADELFGGYNRHIYIHNKGFFVSLIKNILNNTKIRKILIYIFTLFSFSQYVRLLNKLNENQLPRSSSNKHGLLRHNYNDELERDFHHYLPLVLAKVDQSTMAQGIEARTPFLNAEMVSYAFTLKLEELINKGAGKLPLRRILDKMQLSAPYRKRGFTPPFSVWFGRELKEWLLIRWESMDFRVRYQIEEIYGKNAINRMIDNSRIYEDVIWRCLFIDAKIKNIEQNED